MSRRKTKKSSIGRRTELTRQNIQVDEIRKVVRSLDVQWSKKTNYFVLNAGFDREPV